jgi:large subunit ribosomal protein L22
MTEIKASLNNLRIAPRKVKLVADLVRGKSLPDAKNQLRFLTRKPAPLILKLLESAAANAKQNFNLADENNLRIATILVEAGPTLKRWLPRAMGRATPIMKRTCSVKLSLETVKGTKVKKAKISKPQVMTPEEVLAGSQQAESQPTATETEAKQKPVLPARPYGASGQAKKRHFSRQTFGNLKKVFRRKSI